ncbi:MAG: FeoA family protein [Gammaproteobacteria bacterium]
MTSLDQLEEGAKATLIAVDGQSTLRRRLMEMGLLPGTPLQLIRRLDLGGVLELEVRRSRLSLRHAEATHLHVIATA